VVLIDVALGAAVFLWASQSRWGRDRLAQRGGNTTSMNALLGAHCLSTALRAAAALGVVIGVLGANGSL
jgi:hypothetical protein